MFEQEQQIGLATEAVLTSQFGPPHSWSKQHVHCLLLLTSVEQKKRHFNVALAKTCQHLAAYVS